MEPKIKSSCQQKIETLLNVAATLEVLDAVVSPSMYIYLNSSGQIDLTPSSEDDARKLVGSLIRLFKAKPRIEKPYTSSLQLCAYFSHNNVDIKVSNYKGKKCAIKKTEIVHEAEPERTEIIPAKEAYVEIVEELVCEMPEVEAEVTPAPEPEKEVAEVPF